MVARALRSLLAAIGVLLLATVSSCYFSTDDGWYWWWTDDPELVDADAGCFRDLGTTYWYFEADVYDYDGPRDIVDVEADVYDTWRGVWVDSFALEPTGDAWWWYVEWPEQATNLDCYRRSYEVDFVVTDTWGGWDTLTIVPDTW